jgi:hypothetical protein
MEGNEGKLTCIEPFSQPHLTKAKLEIELVQQPVESLDLDFFTCLKSNDILFIDSSHAVKFGGDVCREFLEILPLLPSGVLIHVHDIFFPYDPVFEVVAANHWLCLDYPDEVGGLVPPSKNESAYNGRGSFWMRKVG